MLKDCLEVFITAFGKTTINTFIQTNHTGMQMLGDSGYVLALFMGKR